MTIETKAIREMNMDIENRIQNIFSKKQLKEVLNLLLDKKNIKQLANLMCKDDIFDIDTVLGLIEKYDSGLMKKVLDEPKSEHEMALPIIEILQQKGYKAGQEVPLPKEGKAKPRFMDVGAFHIYKKGLFGGSKQVSVVGVEMKCEGSRGAIDKAFGQAKDYQKYCEQAFVAFSPFLYGKYYDTVKQKAKAYPNIGVWIVGKSKRHLILEEATAIEIPDNVQMQMVEYIKSGKTK